MHAAGIECDFRAGAAALWRQRCVNTPCGGRGDTFLSFLSSGVLLRLIASKLTRHDPLFSTARDQENGWCLFCRAVCCSAAAADAEMKFKVERTQIKKNWKKKEKEDVHKR